MCTRIAHSQDDRVEPLSLLLTPFQAEHWSGLDLCDTPKGQKNAVALWPVSIVYKQKRKPLRDICYITKIKEERNEKERTLYIIYNGLLEMVRLSGISGGQVCQGNMGLLYKILAPPSGLGSAPLYRAYRKFEGVTPIGTGGDPICIPPRVL